MFGLLNVNKPRGLTSRDVVNRVQRVVRPVKTGHAGTLDPLASGVLIICIGQATRLVPILHEMSKVYRATFRLGCTSDTDDAHGDVIELPEAPEISRAQLLAILPEFQGRIEQVPPRYSAVKIKGRRAYNLARAGKDVVPPVRTVEVHRIELLSFDSGEFSLEIECGTGTYIRSIGRDIAARLGSSAVMTELERLRIGPFHVADAVDTEQMTQEYIERCMLPAALAVADWPRYEIAALDVDLLRNGRPLPIRNPCPCGEGERVAVVEPGGDLIALGERCGDQIFPKQVFITVHGNR